MKKLSITILIGLFIYGCSSEYPHKSGYHSVSFDGTSLSSDFKNELTRRNIEFELVERDGKEYILFKRSKDYDVESIVNYIHGGPPKGYTGVCVDSLERARIRIKKLEQHGISTKYREKDYTHCVYWELSNTQKVEEIDESVRQINEHQRSMERK